MGRLKTESFANRLKPGRDRAGEWTACIAALLGLVICLGWPATPTRAQTAGEAAITGTVHDATGAAVPNATVIATNTATGVQTSRTSSTAGVYEVSPLIAGRYNLTITAKGFETFTQDDIELHENQIFGFNPSLKIGSQNQTITVNAAPPQLDTASADLGGTIEDEEFMKLPIVVANNQQRDITQFSNYLPGSQAGSRSSLVSGTASRVEEVYLDGIPLTTISQIGDNRPIFNLVPSEGIGEVGALTSGQSVEYQGAGSINYNMRSGGNKYHGTVADFVRNTIFDTWGFTAPWATEKKLVNNVITTVPVGKPIDHQNEFTFAVGGPVKIPHLYDGHDKLFFYSAYDKTHTRSAPSYTTATIPTTLMQQGNFSQLLTANGGPGYILYDPTTLGACSAVSTTGPCRYAYGESYSGTPGPAGNPSGTPTNIIPAGEISPIAVKMQSFLPTPTTSGIQNNYLGGIPTGYDNWIYSGRIDYTISPKQTLSATVTGGNRHAVPYTGAGNSIPPPYTGTTLSIVAGHWADLSDSYTFRPNLVNQFKYGFSNFGGPPVKNLTDGVAATEATAMGITFTGVPTGQATDEFPTNVLRAATRRRNGEKGVRVIPPQLCRRPTRQSTTCSGSRASTP